MTYRVPHWNPPKRDGGDGSDKSDWIDCPEDTYVARIIRAVDCGWREPYMNKQDQDCQRIAVLFVEVDSDMPEQQRAKGGEEMSRYVLTTQVPLDFNYGPLRSIVKACYPDGVPDQVINGEGVLEGCEDRDIQIRYEGLVYKKSGKWGEQGSPKMDKKTRKQRRDITQWMALGRRTLPLEAPFKTVPEVYGLAKWLLENRVSDDYASEWNQRAAKLRKKKWDEEDAETATKQQASAEEVHKHIQQQSKPESDFREGENPADRQARIKQQLDQADVSAGEHGGDKYDDEFGPTSDLPF